MPLTPLSLAHRTMFADLSERVIDAAFDADFPETGSFVRVTTRNRDYWYYTGYDRLSDGGTGRRIRRYAGRVSDPALTARVEAFARLKTSFTERRAQVRSLHAAGLPRPPAIVGRVVETLARAGVFRLRAVLVGSVAFGCYGGLLGVRLPGSALMTADVDIAQNHGIAISIDLDDSIPDIGAILRIVDPAFAPVPHLNSRTLSTRYRSGDFTVEFLSDERGSDRHQGRPTPLPAIGAAGEPLRLLDFLLRDPVRSVLLHNAGVGVLIPAPERFAVHKLLVAMRRQPDAPGRAKRAKDLAQAALLAEALALEGRDPDLGHAWMEAWDRGPTWRDILAKGLSALEPPAATRFTNAARLAAAEAGRDLPDDRAP